MGDSSSYYYDGQKVMVRDATAIYDDVSRGLFGEASEGSRKRFGLFFTRTRVVRRALSR